MASEDVIPYNNLTLKPLFIEPVPGTYSTVPRYHSMVPDGTVPTRLALPSGAEARSTRSVDALCRCARVRATARGRARFAGGHTRAAGGSEARRAARCPPGRKSARARSAAAAGPRRRGAPCCAAPRPGRGTRTGERAEKKPRPHDEMIILSTVRMPKRRSDGVYTSVHHRKSGSSQPLGAIATVMARGEQGGGGDGRWAGCAPQRVRSARARPRGIPRGTVPAAGCARRRRVSPPQHTVR